MRIQCELSVPKTLSRAQAAVLSFTLINAGDQTVQVLEWQTPFETLSAPIFTVMRDGAEVEYRGRMLKRGAPRKENYFALPPGGRRQATIDLGQVWDVAAPGRYEVEYSTELFDVIVGATVAPRAPDRFESFAPVCGPVEFTRLR